MTAEDGGFCWNSGLTPLLEGLRGLSSACLESIFPLARHSGRTVQALCPKIDKDFLLDPKSSRRVEWAYLADVTSLFRLVSPFFICWHKKDADSAGTGANINRGKEHNAYAGRTSAPNFSFSFGFPCFLHPTGAFEEVRFPKPVDAPQRFDFVHFKHFLSQTTKGIGNCLDTNSNKASVSQETRAML